MSVGVGHLLWAASLALFEGQEIWLLTRRRPGAISAG
jgi:hypothetical protein